MNKLVLLVLMAAIAYEVRGIELENPKVPLCKDGCPAEDIPLTVASESDIAPDSAVIEQLGTPTGFYPYKAHKYPPKSGFDVGVSTVYLYYNANDESGVCQCAFTVTVTVG
ncbi:uncharacterized protein [Amphiura filiformis]|uniref:uncharacterized protein n=1 Tax=Amphiura filiformis TaxID=82378 RepID=UPI003B20F62A